jgi:hypothetical protein
MGYKAMMQLKTEKKNGHLKRGVLVLALAILTAAVAAISGCASSASKVQVGPIAVTDSNGNQLSGTYTSMMVGGTTYVDAAVTNDTSLLGVDWTVSCGSEQTNLPAGEIDDSCGTFTPVHTASAPVPSYATSGTGVVTLYTAPSAPPKGGMVTLYAASTADHSRSSSVTIAIGGLPITIAFAPVPTSSLAVNGTASMKAVVTNDYVAGGVNWSVACTSISKSCGSFSATETASGVATTYTAPSTVPTGGVVTVTATSVTDSTKWVSAKITIN